MQVTGVAVAQPVAVAVTQVIGVNVITVTGVAVLQPGAPRNGVTTAQYSVVVVAVTHATGVAVATPVAVAVTQVTGVAVSHPTAQFGVVYSAAATPSRWCLWQARVVDEFGGQFTGLPFTLSGPPDAPTSLIIRSLIRNAMSALHAAREVAVLGGRLTRIARHSR